ncbi:polysaccharide deacetylase family protein [Compostimonas suwonensis]|uniref:Polysaccharide deacetylase n=1 Tax=Compostimonas suwonensis TaxID=1048394 RepID=A0A2M9C3H7_9MICO|nr:polysaccharide deacetylase [Compostimonas suwonensis]PJJ65100.1 polysaccharide deacetylase [Compostimonas suwonensis]
MTATEPWQWDEPIWRSHIAAAIPGPRLGPVPWPGGAAAAVAISFDSDHETPALRDGQTSPGVLAQGSYGARAGVPRLLAVLAKHTIPATFFVPAVSALSYPEQMRAYVGDGHEVGAHGWIHERTTLLPPGAERELALRALEAVERTSGVRPVGMRTPSWDFSPHTLDIAIELGLLYDSSLMADDEPYELLRDGLPSGLAEVPVDWIRDDAPYFMMDRYSSLRPYTSPDAVLKIWRDELDGAVGEGGVFQLTMHPHIIGHRSRIWILDELLGEIRARGLWATTHADLVRHLTSVPRT